MKLLAAYSYRTVSGSQTSAQVEFRNVRLGSSASSTPIEGKKYSYDSMGNITLISQSTGSMANINPLRYRGYYYDNETGFCYLQSRYKNPTGKDSWHPDLNHPGKIGPHWDYNDGLVHKWRVYPPNSNRNIELVK